MLADRFEKNQFARLCIPDDMRSLIRSPGGKHDFSLKLPALAPFSVTEFREPFASSAACAFAIIRANRAETVWINDIDSNVSKFWVTVRDNPTGLIQELYALHDKFGLGSQEMFDLACQMVGSENLAEAAAGFYVRNRLSRSGTNGMSGFNPSYPRDGRGIKRVHINYIPQFSEWLHGVQITNLDYREVLTAPGEGVFQYLDPPYDGVGRTMYPFGDADLGELARHVRASQHSCLITVDDSPENRVRFSDMHPTVRTYSSSMGNHHSAAELVCANYSTPLYAIHASSIGVMLEPTTVPTAEAIATVPSIGTFNPAANENTLSMPTSPKKSGNKAGVNIPLNENGEKKDCEWYTPEWLLKIIYAANDNKPFDLDPCSPVKGELAPVWARNHFIQSDNGLAHDWSGCVWLNPPYHSLASWLKKAADSVWCRHMPDAPTVESAKREKPQCETVVALFPARTHTRFWQKYVKDHARVFFITGKIAFRKGENGNWVESKDKMPVGLAIVVWGNHTRFTDYLNRLPAFVLEVYERSAPVIPDHPVRYWASLKKEAA